MHCAPLHFTPQENYLLRASHIKYTVRAKLSSKVELMIMELVGRITEAVFEQLFKPYCQ